MSSVLMCFLPSRGPLDGNPPREEARAVDARPGLAWVSVGDPPVSVVRFGRVVEEPSQPKRGHDQFAGR